MVVQRVSDERNACVHAKTSFPSQHWGLSAIYGPDSSPAADTALAVFHAQLNRHSFAIHSSLTS